jgi:hypothetical protein
VVVLFRLTESNKARLNGAMQRGRFLKSQEPTPFIPPASVAEISLPLVRDFSLRRWNGGRTGTGCSVTSACRGIRSMAQRRTKVVDYQSPPAIVEGRRSPVKPDILQGFVGVCLGLILLSSLFFCHAEALPHNEMLAILIALGGAVVCWVAFRRKRVVWLLLGALVPVLVLAVGSVIFWVIFMKGMAAF